MSLLLKLRLKNNKLNKIHPLWSFCLSSISHLPMMAKTRDFILNNIKSMNIIIATTSTLLCISYMPRILK